MNMFYAVKIYLYQFVNKQKNIVHKIDRLFSQNQAIKQKNIFDIPSEQKKKEQLTKLFIQVRLKKEKLYPARFTIIPPNLFLASCMYLYFIYTKRYIYIYLYKMVQVYDHQIILKLVIH